MAIKVTPPAADEYAEFHKGYMAAIANETDGLATLERQQAAIDRLARLTPEQAAFRYADGKWSVKEVTGHLTDGERVLSYRLLRIARGDQTPLPGYDENAFAEHSNADRRQQNRYKVLVGEHAPSSLRRKKVEGHYNIPWGGLCGAFGPRAVAGSFAPAP